MSNHSANRVLFMIIVVLLITNTIMLFLFFLAPKKSKAKPAKPRVESSFADVLKDSVGFSENQVADYLKLRSEERPKLREYYRSLHRVKGQYYDLVSDPAADSASAILADSIGFYQKSIDLHTRNYFLMMRELCTPEQLPAFDHSIKKITNRMVGRQGSRNRNTDSLKTK